MSTGFLRSLMRLKWRWWLLAALLLVVAGVAAAGFWSPELRQQALATLDQAVAACSGNDRHDHANGAAESHGDSEAEHDHAAEAPGAHGPEADGHDHGSKPPTEKALDHNHIDAETVNLSQSAQANVGLRLAEVERRAFERTITVPGIIVERPGRTNIHVAATLTGVITRVWPIQGEAVTPGQPLFDLRLTHEEVVEAQAEFLKNAEELDVVQREIDRLEKVAADGVVSGKTLLERKYEQQRLQASQRSQRQRLMLHGLSASQVADILAKRTLLSELTIVAPEQTRESPQDTAQHLLQVQELKVEKGQHVKAGDPLAVLADHAQLFIQGKAFEQDAPVLDKVANEDWRVTAVIDPNGQSRQTASDLRLVYVASKVEPDSRAFLFYVQLPNKLIRTRQTADGHRFSAWQFKPGQRVELLVPAERWADRIVLPLHAVVQDGPECYVFEKNDGHFDRRAVTVEYRDQYSAVIANDGVLKPGKSVIVAGAYQVHLAMKNKAGGAPDPHAGHNH